VQVFPFACINGVAVGIVIYERLYTGMVELTVENFCLRLARDVTKGLYVVWRFLLLLVFPAFLTTCMINSKTTPIILVHYLYAYSYHTLLLV
jgi:hypothetical protein